MKEVNLGPFYVLLNKDGSIGDKGDTSICLYRTTGPWFVSNARKDGKIIAQATVRVFDLPVETGSEHGKD
jgi:hypothetical protein